jgi:hypothetical protein
MLVRGALVLTYRRARSDATAADDGPGGRSLPPGTVAPRGHAYRRALGRAPVGAAGIGLACALLFNGTFALAAVPASAPPILVDWTGPPTCGSSDAVAEEVAPLLPPRAAQVPVRVAVSVEREDDNRWRAVVSTSWRGATSGRILEADGCATLVSAVAVIVAATVGEATAVERAPPQSTDIPAQHRVPVGPAPSRARVSWNIAVAVAVDDGSLPSVAPGAEAAAGVTTYAGPVRLRVHAGGWLSAPVSRSVPSGERASFLLLEPFVRVCALAVAAPLEIGPCVGGAADIAWPTAIAGPGPTFRATPRSGRWFAPSESLYASAATGRHARIFLRADVVEPTPRPTFVVSRVQAGNLPLFTPARAAVRGELGLALDFF